MKSVKTFFAILFFSSCLVQAADEPIVTFKQQNIVFSNGTKLKVEMAENNAQHGQGLMFRKKLEPGHGMLFVFPRPQRMSFWMKNTLVPLSIGFLNAKKVLIEVMDMEPPLGPVRDENLPHYESKDEALYALEVPKGWFAAQKIKLGSHFSFKK